KGGGAGAPPQHASPHAAAHFGQARAEVSDRSREPTRSGRGVSIQSIGFAVVSQDTTGFACAFGGSAASDRRAGSKVSRNLQRNQNRFRTLMIGNGGRFQTCIPIGTPFSSGWRRRNSSVCSRIIWSVGPAVPAG